jgi:MazG family protein
LDDKPETSPSQAPSPSGQRLPARPAQAAGRIEALVALVAILRGENGCPWDREQTAADLRPYLLEEAHEVAAALDGGDWEALRNELGDLLFQIVFLASLAQSAGRFALPDVIDAVHRKMVERHPHVFGEPHERLNDAAAVRSSWEKRKASRETTPGGHLDGVAPSLPALVAALRLTQKAAGVGFDWPDAAGVLEKLGEEIRELEAALRQSAAEAAATAGIEDEIGDLLFTVANLARKLRLDPEAALAKTNLKFRRRFAFVESAIAANGRNLSEATLAEMDSLWRQSKRTEATSPPKPES